MTTITKNIKKIIEENPALKIFAHKKQNSKLAHAIINNKTLITSSYPNDKNKSHQALLKLVNPKCS